MEDAYLSVCNSASHFLKLFYMGINKLVWVIKR